MQKFEYVRSVLKALSVLEQFINSNKEKGVHELSTSTNLPVSTIQRLVNTLQVKGYLIQNPITKKYRLGYALYNLGRSFSNNLNWIDEAKCYMTELVNEHQETVNLAILEGHQIVYLTKVDSPHILRPNFTIGTKYPAHCTSLGKCLLAHLPPKVLESLLKEPLDYYTEKTVIDVEKLTTELIEIRNQGYAIDDEEFQEGLRCTSVPIKNNNMDGVVVAALGLTAPKNRMTMEKLLEIKDDLVKASNKISQHIM